VLVAAPWCVLVGWCEVGSLQICCAFSCWNFLDTKARSMVHMEGWGCSMVQQCCCLIGQPLRAVTAESLPYLRFCLKPSSHHDRRIAESNCCLPACTAARHAVRSAAEQLVSPPAVQLHHHRHLAIGRRPERCCVSGQAPTDLWKGARMLQLALAKIRVVRDQALILNSHIAGIVHF
jgi:hypothetical protein